MTNPEQNLVAPAASSFSRQLSHPVRVMFSLPGANDLFPGTARQVFRVYLLLAGVAALIISILRTISAWLTADLSRELQSKLGLPAEQLLPPAAGFFFGLIVAVLVWAFYLIAVALVRQFAARALEDTPVPLKTMLGICAISATPLFFGAVLSYFIQMLFLPRTAEAIFEVTPFAPAVRLVIFFGAVLWEGIIFVRLLRRSGEFPRRRVVLICVAPIALIALTLMLAVLGITLYNAFARV